MKKCLYLIIPILLLASCSTGKKKYITLQLHSTCTPIDYFDTLRFVLLTNNRTDIDKNYNGGVADLFTSSERVYKTNVTEKNNQYYIDSVPAREFWVFYTEARLMGNGYVGWVRDLDFSDKKEGDTVLLDFCMKPIIQRMPG